MGSNENNQSKTSVVEENENSSKVRKAVVRGLATATYGTFAITASVVAVGVAPVGVMVAGSVVGLGLVADTIRKTIANDKTRKDRHTNFRKHRSNARSIGEGLLHGTIGVLAIKGAAIYAIAPIFALPPIALPVLSTVTIAAAVSITARAMYKALPNKENGIKQKIFNNFVDPFLNPILDKMSGRFGIKGKVISPKVLDDRDKARESDTEKRVVGKLNKHAGNTAESKPHAIVVAMPEGSERRLGTGKGAKQRNPDTRNKRVIGYKDPTIGRTNI